MDTSYQGWLPEVLKIADKAGGAVLSLYHTDKYTIKHKLDNSPLTEADLLSEEIIKRGLKALTPDIPILSEEGSIPDFEVRKAWRRLWLIDPIDGTQEFIEKTREFTINIALVEDHRPQLGVVLAPALGLCYWALAGGTAYCQIKGEEPLPIHTASEPIAPFRVLISRHHHRGASPQWQKFLERLGSHELIRLGSALKICRIAEGLADIYPRFGPTSEWDTAAGQCILEAAGGQLVDIQGKVLQYNRGSSVVNPDFYAFGSSKLKTLVCG